MMRGDRCDADCNVANVKWQAATENNRIIFRVWITLDIVGCSWGIQRIWMTQRKHLDPPNVKVLGGRNMIGILGTTSIRRNVLKTLDGKLENKKLIGIAKCRTNSMELSS
jgi:hypothetical protein